MEVVMVVGDGVVVEHGTGTLALVGDELVSRMSGTRGLFRKEAWEKVDRIPLASVSAVRVIEDGERVDLAFTVARGLPQAYPRCGPPDAVEALLEAIVEASPAVTVNDVDVAERRRTLAAEAKARGEEVVGVERRITLTRLALGGVVGGLLFQKRKVVRRRDL